MPKVVKPTRGQRQPLTRNDVAVLREQRAAAYHRMNAALDSCPADTLTAEARNAYDAAEREFDALTDRIEAYEAREAGARRGSLFAREGGATMDGPFLAPEARMADWAREQGMADDDEGTPDDERHGPFSLGAAVRGIATGRWDGAEAEHRALGSGSSGTGGVLVPSLVASEVFDTLANEATAIQAGARIVPMKAQTVTLPKVESLPTPGWRDENDPVTTDDPGFGGIQLKAKTLAVLCKVPYELFEDVSAESSKAISDALTTALALELDRAAYFGDGSNDEPVGLVNTPGVATTALATNGAVPADYSALTAAFFACRRRNTRPNAAVYSERTAETFAGLTATDGQPLLPPPALANLEQLSTNAIPDDQDEGTSTGVASSLIVGQFDQLVIGARPEFGFRVVSGREAFMSNMQVAVLAYVRADVGVIRPEAFDVRTGILAS